MIDELTINRFFTKFGINIKASSGDRVKGCYLGLNSDGLSYQPFTDASDTQLGGVGVETSGNTIGGPLSSDANVISGNSAGITFSGGGSSKVLNNKIGTDKNGNAFMDSSTVVSGNLVGILISASDGNTIGGNFGSTGNQISDNGTDGLVILNSKNTLIKGNFIGTDASGLHAVQNGRLGIGVSGGASSGNIIGGPNPSDRNIISGNNFDATSAGVLIDVSASTGNQVIGNYIGVDVNAQNPIPNTTGVLVYSSGQMIGTAQAPNVVSGNTGPGIRVTGSGSTVTSISIAGNFVGVNQAGDRFRNLAGILISGDVQGAIIKGNIISGNLDGFGIGLTIDPTSVTSPTGTSIIDNKIGTDPSGTMAVPNTIGIAIQKSSGNTIIGNVVSGNSTYGISLGNTDADDSVLTASNTIQRNLIGTNASGSDSLSNLLGGIGLLDNAENNLIGGSISADQGNVISGNTNDDQNIGYGVFIGSVRANASSSSYPSGNLVQGNRIGLQKNADAGVPNNWGAYLDHAQNNTIGGDTADLANIIGFNAHDGVYIINTSTTGNVLNNNYIGVMAGGTFLAPNQGDGISVLEGAVDTKIVNNTIGGNGGNGIHLTDISPAVAPRPNGPVRPQDQTPTVEMVGNQIGVATDESGNTIPVGNGLSGVELDCVQQAMIRANSDYSALSNIIAANHNAAVAITRNIGNRPGRSPQQGPCDSINNLISSSFIGTDQSGTTGLGNGSNGIEVDDSSSTTIGGPGVGNVIAGNLGNGIMISGGSGNNIYGNNIGVVPNGVDFSTLGNQLNGIDISDSTNDEIGGLDPTESNIIAANQQVGVQIDQLTNLLKVRNNLIGTIIRNLPRPANGKVRNDPAPGDFGNGLDGIWIENGSYNNYIGGSEPNAGNDIEYNGGSGVNLDASAGNGNLIDPNLIANNSRLGIDLGGSGLPLPNDPGDADTGPNNLQNYPEITDSSIDGNGDLIVAYFVDSQAENSDYGTDGLTGLRVEFFKADAQGQGQSFLGSDQYTVADHDSLALGARRIGQQDPSFAAGVKSVNLGNAAALGFGPGDEVTATASDVSGNTSEFFPPTAPSAAGVSVGGRITFADGRPVSGAALTLANVHGVRMTALSNPFGYYRFDGVEAGATYILSVSSKRAQFPQPSRILSIEDSLADVDFVAQE